MRDVDDVTALGDADLGGSDLLEDVGATGPSG
jgi:hypothetical protein